MTPKFRTYFFGILGVLSLHAITPSLNPLSPAPAGPVAAALKELTMKLTFFSANTLTKPSEQALKQQIYLLSDVFALTSITTDSEYRPVRTDEIISEFTEAIIDLAKTAAADPACYQLVSQNTLLAEPLLSIPDRSAEHYADLGTFVQQSLTQKSTGKKLISSLLGIIETYCKETIGTLVNFFKSDLRTLVSANTLKRGVDDDGKTLVYEQKGDVCLLAATTCKQVLAAVAHNPLTLSREIADIVTVTNEFLDVMILTYRSLARAQGTLTDTQKQELHHHIASLIRKFTPQTVSSTPGTSYIKKCQEQTDPTICTLMVKAILAKQRESEVFLEQFFSILAAEASRDLRQLSARLEQSALRLLDQQCWQVQRR